MERRRRSGIRQSVPVAPGSGLPSSAGATSPDNHQCSVRGSQSCLWFRSGQLGADPKLVEPNRMGVPRQTDCGGVTLRSPVARGGGRTETLIEREPVVLIADKHAEITA